jgi:hypothetical protein
VVRSRRLRALGAVGLSAVLLAAGCSDEEPSFEVGSCIADGDDGVEVVDCDSGDAELRLVEQSGTDLDVVEPDCPEDTEVVVIEPSDGGVGLRWCVEEA